MPNVIAPVLDDLFTALGDFIQSMLPTNTPIVQGLDNRVPEPLPAAGFVVMTAVTTLRLATTVDSWDQTLTAPTTLEHHNSIQVGIQVDFYGPSSMDWANMFSTLFRNTVGCDALAPTCQPLYADDAVQAPLIDGEEQYEQRWLVNAQLEYDPTVSTAQDFADTLEVGLINVDVAYPAT